MGMKIRRFSPLPRDLSLEASMVRAAWDDGRLGDRRAAAWAIFLGRRAPKVSSRLTFWPAAISSASALTFSRRLSLNLLIPCRSFASAKNGSTPSKKSTSWSLKKTTGSTEDLPPPA